MQYIQRIKWFFSLIRDAWLIIGVTILFLVIGQHILGIFGYIKDNSFPRHARSPVYDNFPDKRNFWLEQREARYFHFEPYHHFRRNEFIGKYTNVSQDGVRLTTREGTKSDARKIFLFGGSTMWGTGSPDSQTIPSLLQAHLGNAGDVYNFGENGYVSAQELNYLLYQLSIGNVPDVVIFYDGINDGYAGAYSPAIPRDPNHLRERRKIDRESWSTRIASVLYEGSNYKRLVNNLERNFFSKIEPDGEWGKKIENDIRINSSSVLDMYEAHIRQVQALAKEYEFKALFFWQPNLFSVTRKTNSFEDSIVENADSTLVRSQREVYEVAKERLSNREDEDIYFLGNMFDEISEPIYIDWMHTGPNGNQIVAKEIFQKIEN